MTWYVLPTYVDGDPFTWAQLMQLRDNFNETAPARATTAGRIFATTGPYGIAEREIRQHYLAGSGTTAGTSFGDLSGGAPNIGPTVSNIITGPLALVCVESQVNNTNNGASSRMSYEISGATTSSPVDDRGILDQNSANYDNRYGTWELQPLTPGSNTFVARYRVSSGSGAFSARTIIVMAL